ncbi:helix-turn-helix domain-containing protein [Dorea formicigenerans]|nr:helix-turn-helix domain-containing protein [Dorea formicigenerans]
MKRNISCTAAKLKIHRNTLIPRLEKINDILELDNLDGKECEKLLVSLEIERMKNNKSSEKQ